MDFAKVVEVAAQAVVAVLLVMAAAADATPEVVGAQEGLRLSLALLSLGLKAGLADMAIQALLEAQTPAKEEVLELQAVLE